LDLAARIGLPGVDLQYPSSVVSHVVALNLPGDGYLFSLPLRI
jgi:hypothetical protein